MNHENGILLYKELQRALGSQTTLRVFQLLQGQQIYFPAYILQQYRNKAIRQDFRRGMSYKQLSQKYRLTQKHIRCITGHKMPAAQESVPGYLF